jgi:hypothetical protein
MTGRDSEISSFDLMLARSKRHLHNRGMVLSGLRGVGKTVLLNSLRNHADKMGWLTVGLEGRPGGLAAEAIREKLARELLLGARKFVRRPAADRLREAFRSIRRNDRGPIGSTENRAQRLRNLYRRDAGPGP